LSIINGVLEQHTEIRGDTTVVEGLAVMSGAAKAEN
jgi:hypothetical protein